MSGFESSAEAAWLNGAIGKQTGLIQGRNEGAAIGYQAGFDDGVAQGADHAAQVVQSQLDAMYAELESLRAENQRLRIKWRADQEFVAGLSVVVSAAQSALATSTPAQRLEFLKQYSSLSRQMRTHGAIACDPDASPRFHNDMPSTVAFIRHLFEPAKTSALPLNDLPSP